jgi:hypothetical protein
MKKKLMKTRGRIIKRVLICDRSNYTEFKKDEKIFKNTI